MVAIFVCSTSFANGQQPSLGYVYPPVVTSETTTEVDLGGYDFTPDMQFFVHHPHIRLQVLGPPGPFLVPGPPYWFGEKGSTTAFPIPRELRAKIIVPANMPPGPIRWQVANANGSSSTAVFYISASSPVLENRLRDEVQTLADCDVCICGRLKRISEVDRYQFRAKQDGPITIELLARQLGSDFHGLLEVRDDEGKMLVSSADTEGIDTTVTFAAKKAATYRISLHDVAFRGNRAFVYQLRIKSGPRVVAHLPAHGKRGKTRNVKFVGYGLSKYEDRLETISRQVVFPDDAKVDTFPFQLKTATGPVTVNIPLSNIDEITEANASVTTPQNLSVPSAVTGVLATPAEEDRYTFSAEKDSWVRIDLQSRALGSKLDVALQILDPDGKVLSTVDNVNKLPDAAATIRIKKTGIHTCVVRDLSGHDGTEDAVYRLKIDNESPGFSLSLPQQINASLGGKVQVPVTITRHGGFSAGIQLRVDGLPDGIQCEEKSLTIPAKKTKSKLTLEVAKDAAATAALIRVVGVATIDGKKITATATANGDGNLCPRSEEDRQTSQILLTTTMAAPFSVELVDKNRQRAVHRGTTYPAEFLIKRTDGFSGEIVLRMAAKQARHRQGITAPILMVPANTDRILYPCFLPEWLETDRTTRMVVHGVAKVADPKGQVRYLTKAANARITMILEGALLKLSHNAHELTVIPGKSFSVPLQLAQSEKLKEDVRIELTGPKSVRKFLKAESISVDAKTKQTTLLIRTMPDEVLVGDWNLTIKATAMKDNRWPVVSQTEVPVRFLRGGN